MKLQQIMTKNVVTIHPNETAEVAARLMQRSNIGILPVCDQSGALRGVVTDRDLVTRCIASGNMPNQTCVREIMTSQVITVGPELDTGAASHLMGRKQVRRLPVLENGKLCGMVSLGDLAVNPACSIDTADALTEISESVVDG